MAAQNKNRLLLGVFVALLLLGILGSFKKAFYGYCLSSQICEMPALDGFDIRMKFNWIPEVYDLSGSKLLAFEKDGQSRSDGGVVIKFVRDPASSKLLAARFTRKTYPWGVGYEGTSDMVADIISPPATTSYLVVPELELLITSNDPSAFADIVRMEKKAAQKVSGSN